MKKMSSENRLPVKYKSETIFACLTPKLEKLKKSLNFRVNVGSGQFWFTLESRSPLFMKKLSSENKLPVK